MEKPSQRAVTAAVKAPAPPRKTPPNIKKLTKQLAGIMAHLEQHPTDSLSRARVDKIKELLAS